ncbi:MAG: protease complex subunit PrcB family protein [Minisyncoccia bacterium]
MNAQAEDHHLLFVTGLLALIIAIVIVFFPPRLAGGMGVAVSYSVLDQGPISGVSSRVNYLITDQAGFKNLWQMLHGASSTPPTVDFSQNEVIALFAGAEPTAGYEIGIASISATAAHRLVSVDIGMPAAGCASTSVETTPYELAVLPASSLPLSHEDVAVAAPCGN